MKEKIEHAYARIQSDPFLAGFLGSLTLYVLLAVAGAIMGVMPIMAICDALLNINSFYLLQVIFLILSVVLGALLFKQAYAFATEWVKKEEVSKEHFGELEAIVRSFERLFDTAMNPLVGFLGELDDVSSELLGIQTRLKGYSSYSYNHCKKRLKRFDGTLEDFELLADEFESVFYAYEDLFVKPVAKRKDEIAKNTQLKEKYNKFASDYEHLRRKYIDYGDRVNKEYGRTVIRTDFEYVGTL